jgi:hypothetical protein
MYDFGHESSDTPPRDQTGGPAPISPELRNLQRRFFSRPFFRHASHLHPAWLDS